MRRTFQELQDDTIDLAKEGLIEDLKTLCPAHIHLFKRMYAHDEVEPSIEQVVYKLKPDQLNQAMKQVAATIIKNKK